MTDGLEVERQALLAEATELEVDHARLLLRPDAAGSLKLSRKLQAHAARFYAFTEASRALVRQRAGDTDTRIGDMHERVARETGEQTREPDATCPNCQSPNGDTLAFWSAKHSDFAAFGCLGCGHYWRIRTTRTADHE